VWESGEQGEAEGSRAVPNFGVYPASPYS
jgi:hypothetical protein